jgi:EAL domain-containing protein (putative c-di-GMP-specific phosphodiesterase class I)
VSVNVSARQIQEPAFVQEVAAILATTGLLPERLTLELTESVLMHDVDATATTLNALKALGVRLAIDDFGTGYSSLSYLGRFPIDELKIDRSFVAAMNTGPDESALVRSIVKLGETLHLETVAEGIEQADQLAELRALGAGLGQGFLFARPLSPEDLSLFLAQDAERARAIIELGAA